MAELIFFILAFIYTFPFFKNISNWGIQDWDLDIFNYAVPRLTLLKYHQFPLWNPFYCGGVPLLANPQSKFLSPIFLLVLIFGEVIGLKIIIYFHLVLGLLGMYLLARFFKMHKYPSLLASSFFMLNSMYFLNINVGMTTFIFMSYLPWIFLFFLKSFSKLKNILISILFLILMLFGGGIQLFFIIFFFLLIYSLLMVFSKKFSLFQVGQRLILITLLTILLGAVKLLPAIDLSQKYPRLVNDWSGYSFQSLFFSLMSRDQNLISVRQLPLGGNLFYGINHELGMEEQGMYIGPILAFFFFIGFFSYALKKKKLAIVFVFFLWLIFGNRAPFSLWELIRLFPIFNLMRVAQRFRFIVMMIGAIFAGLGLEKINHLFFENRPHFKKLFNLTIFLLVIVDLFLVNFPIINKTFIVKPIRVEKNKEFSQVQILPNYDQFGWRESDSDMTYRSWSSLYPTFLSNQGTIEAYEPIPFPKNAFAKDSLKYRGEVFLKDTSGKVNFSYWSPNKLIIDVHTLSDGYLVINQNYFPGWRVKNHSKLYTEPVENLLGIKISPTIERVELYFLPTSFIIGLVVSSLSLIGTLGFLLRRRLFCFYPKTN